MRVIGINGSPRKSKNSATLLEKALCGAEENGAETKLYHLIDHTFSRCRSCFACKRLGGDSFGKCAVRDDLAPILDDILNADGLIVSMPIYFGDVPGMVRNLMERLWFPGLLYRKDGKLAYDKTIKVGLIYTMNAPDEQYYDALIASHKGTFERFFGETSVLCATDTLQYDDYSLYTGDMFDPVHKKERHQMVFPQDCEKAHAMGVSLLL